MMYRGVVLLITLLWAGQLSGILPVGAAVVETYIELDYIICLEDIMVREYARQSYVPYNEEVLEYACIEKLLFPRAQKPVLDDTQNDWLQGLFTQTALDIESAGSTPTRVRKEYRTLSTTERSAFHNAVRQLKTDTRKYDALASLHVGATALSAHRGPGFFTWHRIFLLLFENALREYDRNVALPYWDPSLDAALEDPKTSVLWSNTFAGNGDGIVTTGPFANWATDGTPLIRNIGESGRLIKSSDIDNVLSKRRLGEISFPNAELVNNLELHSYGVQMWVGGDMGRLATAANDPLYFLLHAHTDCVWMEFRENQTDPETDWPWRYEGNTAHSVNALLQLFDIRSRNVIAGDYSFLYRCEAVPRCVTSTDCQSPNLRCDGPSNRCVSAIDTNLLQQEQPCQGTQGYQNTYCLDGSACDVAEWGYLPVEIVYTRPPDYGIYNSRPLLSPTWVFHQDIYSPRRFNRTGDYRAAMAGRPDNPGYRQCRCSESDYGRVYIQSYGLNYDGSYREYVPVDRRLPVSSVVGYVAVKRPVAEASRVMIRVYDDCGRVCTAVCPPVYGNCSGVMEVSQAGGGYGVDLENALYISWDFTSEIPKSKDDFALKFYCTFNADWPFGGMGFLADPNEPRPNRTDGPDERPLTTTTTTIRTTPTTTTTTTTPTTTVLIEPVFCFNSSECYGDYEPTGCVRCEVGAFSPCPDGEKKFYRRCGLGSVWQIQPCPSPLVWDQELTVCNFQYAIDFRRFFSRFLSGTFRNG